MHATERLRSPGIRSGGKVFDAVLRIATVVASLQGVLAGVAIVALSIAPALAQTAPYPNRPIRLVTPFPPGGATDVLSRIISERMQEDLGQPVLVDNKGGAAGMIGTDFVAKSPPDGYTIANVISSHAIQQYLYKSVPYDYIKDFEPVILYARSALAFVVPADLPVNNVKEYIAWVKASGKPVSYGTSGVGAAVHLAMESFAQAAGLNLQHVPYKGGGPAVQDVLGGHIPGVMLGLSTVAQYVKAGKLKALFISSARRHKEFPDVPTLQESGFPGLVVDEWWAILAPAGTPRPIINTLNAEIAKIFARPDVEEKISKLGVEFIGSTPAQVGEFMQAESARNAKVIKSARIEPQ